MRAGAEGADVAFHAAAHLGEWGTREEFERANVQGTRNAVEASRGAGVRRFVHVGTEAGLLAGTAARERRRERAAATGLEGPLLRDQGAGRAGRPRRERRRFRDRGRAAAARVGSGRHDNPAEPRAGGRERAVRVDRRRAPPHLDHARRQRHPRADAGCRARPPRRGLLRDRRRAGRLPRLHHGAARHAGRDTPGAATCRRRSRMRWPPAPRACGARSGSAGSPPITRLAYWLSAQECTIDISHAREELGYEPVRSIPEGMEELRA